MKKVFIVGCISFITLNAGFMDSMVSQMGNMMQGMSSAQGSARANTQNTAQLVSQLTQLLNVNPKQAVGGTAALMALASSKMPKKNYNSLINSVPGLSSIAGGASPLSSILGMVGGNSKNINTAFKALGMDSSMSSKFAPALLEIFKQYTNNQNINQLSKVWSPFLQKK